MQPTQSSPFNLNAKGIIQKIDPAAAGPDAFYQASNIYVQQEGGIACRTGHKSLTAGQGINIHSLSKLVINSTDTLNPRYTGVTTGGKVFRYTNFFGAAADVTPTGGLTNTKWSYAQYDAGAIGAPYGYFASSARMAKDSGAYSILQNWGLDPPAIPVSAVLGAYALQEIGVPSPTARFTTMTTSAVSPASTVGYTQLTVPTPANCYVGTLVTITDSGGGNSEDAIVENVDDTSIYCVLSIGRVAGCKVDATQYAFTTPGGLGTTDMSVTGLTIDAAFNGTQQDGYVTDDIVHIGMYIEDPTLITDIRVRIVPNFTSAPYATDYYEKSILPSLITQYAIANQNSITALQQLSSQVAQGIAGPYSSANTTGAQIQPLQTDPAQISPAQPVWTEFDIPKSQFTPIGNAGSGPFTWLNINQAYVHVASQGATNMAISSFYITGGYGPNNSGPSFQPYSWCYCYRNPFTQAEGNPSVPMVSPNLPPSANRQQYKLTLTGLDFSNAAGNVDISGDGSIAVYRAGGSFADGIYRLVGYAINPGANATAIFYDEVSDAQLAYASDTLYTDNDPPVPSTMAIPFQGSVAGFRATGGGGSPYSPAITNATQRIYANNLPSTWSVANINQLTVGSTVFVGTGTTAEQVIVSASGYDGTHYWFEAFLQYPHNVAANPFSIGGAVIDPSEIVECSVSARTPCYLTCEAFDSMFLAGQALNPHVLYKSKTGSPESFPAVENDGTILQINVGSPANPIYGITPYADSIICLNRDDLYVVSVFAGVMQNPIATNSKHGMVAPFCFCQGDGAIWFMAVDGIYKWQGGQAQLVSEVDKVHVHRL